MVLSDFYQSFSQFFGNPRLHKKAIKATKKNPQINMLNR